MDLDEQLELKPVTSKEIQETKKKVDEHLKKDPTNKTLKKAKKQLSEYLLLRKQKYE
ncbi:hypothetical protein PB1_00225 [Bacillus methanolicus PB1]|uniref:Uncharacterized protein n=1 Tax=Bacillus methanolicus PB1 TaxID=997296 RepID=I3E4A5_BACMT|nr:hypothetical protein PB1_00225 [Bacillus methanolicus PB1]